MEGEEVACLALPFVFEKSVDVAGSCCGFGWRKMSPLIGVFPNVTTKIRPISGNVIPIVVNASSPARQDGESSIPRSSNSRNQRPVSVDRIPQQRPGIVPNSTKYPILQKSLDSIPIMQTSNSRRNK